MSSPAAPTGDRPQCRCGPGGGGRSCGPGGRRARYRCAGRAATGARQLLCHSQQCHVTRLPKPLDLGAWSPPAHGRRRGAAGGGSASYGAVRRAAGQYRGGRRQSGGQQAPPPGPAQPVPAAAGPHRWEVRHLTRRGSGKRRGEEIGVGRKRGSGRGKGHRHLGTAWGEGFGEPALTTVPESAPARSRLCTTPPLWTTRPPRRVRPRRVTAVRCPGPSPRGHRCTGSCGRRCRGARRPRRRGRRAAGRRSARRPGRPLRGRRHGRSRYPRPGR